MQIMFISLHVANNQSSPLICWQRFTRWHKTATWREGKHCSFTYTIHKISRLSLQHFYLRSSVMHGFHILFNTQAQDIILVQSKSLERFQSVSKTPEIVMTSSTSGCSAPKILSQAFSTKSCLLKHTGLDFSPQASWFD